MKPVYTLLRNNQTLGPFSLKDLAAIHLSKNDLVWVEGESKQWNAAMEFPEINSKIFGFKEGRANADLLKAGSTGQPEVELVLKYSRPLEDLKADYMAWVSSNRVNSVKRPAYNFRTVPFLFIIMVILSMLLFKANDQPANDLVQTSSEISHPYAGDISALK